MLSEWTGPYQGVPAFDQMDVSNLQDAMETGIALALEEYEEIANQPEPATSKTPLWQWRE